MIQISNNIRTLIRPVELRDQTRLANILHFETHIHRHLDWISPLELIGKQPFLVIEQEGKIEAALSSPIDPEDVAWIRLFAASGAISYEAAWQLLWNETKKELIKAGGAKVAAIGLHKWMANMLERSGFQRMQDVVFLVWDDIFELEQIQLEGVTIRPMNRVDMEVVCEIDNTAFKPIWRNSLNSLIAAFDQAHIATVAEEGNKLIAYQISTSSHMGGHLARLAVHPHAQGKKIGKALVVDTLRKFQAENIHRVSVNTQEDNFKSVNLYKGLGFRITGERYSIYEIDLKR